MRVGARGLRLTFLFADCCLLLTSAPLLLFPALGNLWLGVTLAGLSWVPRHLATGRWLMAGTAPALVLLALGALGTAISIRPETSLARLGGLVLGVSLAGWCAAWLAPRPGLARLTLLVVGLGVAAIGLLGMLAPPDKLPIGPELYRDLERARPRELAGAPARSVVGFLDADPDDEGGPGFNPNIVGGLLALFAPVAVVLTVRGGWLAPLAGASAVALLAALALTQSRSAIGGVLVALALGAAWWAGQRLIGRRLLDSHRLPPPEREDEQEGLVRPERLGEREHLGRQRGLQDVGWLGVVLLGLAVLGATLFALLGALRPVAMEGGALVGRWDIWALAALMALDQPLTGVGLGAFPAVLHDFYPTLSVDRGIGTITHAHNNLLQSLVDLGLPGTLALALFTLLAAQRGLAGLRHGLDAPLAAALLLALLAHLLFGLTDAIPLGTKPSLATWLVVGLLSGTSPPSTLPTSGRGSSPLSLWERLRARACPLLPLAAGKRVGVRDVISMLAILGLFLVAMAPLNLARIGVHRANAGLEATAPMTDGSLAVARALGWGPLGGRVLLVEALAARARGDVGAEVARLEAALARMPWDPTVPYRLGELYWYQGDLASAARVWGAERVVDLLRSRGAHDEAATHLAAALRARGSDRAPAERGSGRTLWTGGSDQHRAVVAARLEGELVDLPAAEAGLVWSADAGLYARASQLLERRQDLAGALYAAQLAAHAEPGLPAHWERLAELWTRLGQPERAAEARARANP